jgi:hypothetical protein
MKKLIIILYTLFSFTSLAQIANFNVPGYAIPLSGQGNWSAATIDMNNDGWNDVFISRGFQKDLFLINNGDGTFFSSPDTASWQIAGGSYKAVVLDLNADGFSDIVIARGPESGGNFMSATGQDMILLNNGDGSFTDKSSNFPIDMAGFFNVNQYNYSLGVAFGKLNHDTIPDFVFANGFIRFLPLPGPFENINTGSVEIVSGGYWRFLQNDLFLSTGAYDADNCPVYHEPSNSVSGLIYEDVSTDVVIADFNNDAFDDIFIVNYYHPGIATLMTLPLYSLPLNDTLYFSKLYLNDPQNPGKFNWDKTKFPLIKYPATAAATDDINNDGFIDLVLTMDARAGNLHERTRLFINDGTGKLNEDTAQYLITADTFNFTGFEAQFADVNNDGRKDLFIAGQKSKIFIKQPDNTFVDITGSVPLHQSIMKPHIFSALGACIDDLNNDGKADAILAGSYEQLRLWLQNTSGAFIDATTTNLPPDGENTEAAAIADLDNDGDMDIVNVVFLEEIPFSVYIQEGTAGGYPYFEDRSNILPSSLTNNRGVDIADVNNDGFKDIIISGYHGTKIYRNNGNLNFTDSSSTWGSAFSSSIHTNQLRFADLDNDGFMDVFFPNGTEGGTGEQNRVYSWNHDTGLFEDKTSLWLPADNLISINCDFADINNDGFKDILVANQIGVSCIYLSTAPITTDLNYTMFTPFAPSIATGIHFGDFNGDNLMDVVEVSSHENLPINIYLNTGNASNPAFSLSQTIVNTGISGATWDVEVVDINNDGSDDFITADFGESQVFISNGDGAFSNETSNYFPQPELREAWFAKSLQLADINQDGNIDIYFCRDNQDFILYGHSPSVGVYEIIQNGTDVIIYPNPFSSLATLQAGNPLINAAITVYNPSGQVVMQINNFNGQTITLNRDNLPNGLYFVYLTQDSKLITTKKIIITD